MLLSIGTLLAFILPVFGNDYDLDSLTDLFLRDVINRLPSTDLTEEDRSADLAVPFKSQFDSRRDSILSKEPSLRDKEYLEHSSLFGHKYMAGGGDEGLERLGPSGSIDNVQIVQPDGALPVYCNPPNPCPMGYTAEDGCLEDFENTAKFSRDYQEPQDCICDSEHMFNCAGSSRENEIDALARTFESEGLAESILDKLMKTMSQPLNPYLEGEKLPVVAKKMHKLAIE